MTSTEPKRGDLFWIDWSPGRGSEQQGRRPALIVQTDSANTNPRYTNTIVVAVSTKGRPVPLHVALEPTEQNGLSELSYAKCEQLMTISKDRLGERIGQITAEEQLAVDQALRRALSLNERYS
ncbi:type II toxin-antitoxin system PemK/MazF family toxin [Armatimonas sp.]|uniref:type II toxin-antitoxin system PemK/MazF family toxin n=1 Tax=Armatimonas sp. TaxID=1872638 RepID=UPI00374CE394